MPRSCLAASSGDEACVLTVHHLRERKTGPQIPIAVLQCQTHRRAFTVYPFGHIPYGRVAVAPVALDGEMLFSTAGETHPDGKKRPAWETTLLGPAFAAVQGKAVKITDPRWWATQTAERLSVGAALLGVHPDLSAPDGDAIALRLEIPRLVLREAAGNYERAHGPAGRGRVLVGVLDHLGSDACLLDRVLAAGAVAGCWGTVTRWDPASGGARGRVFPGRGAPAG
jgi:hypothetical protein